MKYAYTVHPTATIPTMYVLIRWPTAYGFNDPQQVPKVIGEFENEHRAFLCAQEQAD